MARFTVDATAHVASTAVPGELTVSAALSDTTIAGQPVTKGQAQFTFTAGAVSRTLPGTLPALPSTAGGTVVEEGTQTWLAFPLGQPLVGLDPSDPRIIVGTITYDVFESFRWRDLDVTGYAVGVFDLDATQLTFEPVLNFGATGYHVTIE
jgi:hypothetical protein